MNPDDIDAVPTLVGRLYEIVAEFERLFPGRRFTPDVHLVGSIGEVAAAHRYGLALLPAGAAVHDAKNKNDVMVQIKATQGASVALSSEPEHLLVLRLLPDGECVEVFNGPGPIVWAACGPMQKTGQRPISLTKLRALMAKVLPSEQLALK
jgi:hypothetical protein